MAKIGRNSPCQCGSGKKHKHCHGALRLEDRPGFKEAFDRARSRHAATEEIRQRQQGYGKGIIHANLNQARIVAVGNTIYQSTKWRFFSDFLVHFIRHKLGPLAPSHPVARWFDHLQAKHHASAPNGPVASVFGGYIASFFYLAYALYLIAHHDQLPEPLLKRLRNRETALPAAYEAFVGAAFAISGFAIKSEETKATGKPQGEFTVTSKLSGKSYSVEAKRKDGWRNPFTESMTPEFSHELHQYVWTRFTKAARKKLPNPIYWIELSIQGLQTQAQFMLIRDVVQATLRRAEDHLAVDGGPPEPAYVFVTNHGHLADDSLTEQAVFAWLEPFRMPTFPRDGVMELEDAMVAHDEHRDATSIIQALQEVKRIPASFDGTPDELITPNGDSLAPPKVGDRLQIVGPDGRTTAGTIQEITAAGKMAWIVLKEDETNQNVMGQIHLRAEETAAANVYGDAIFGKTTGGKHIDDGDYITLYDWFLGVYKEYSREALLNQVRSHARFSEYEKLDLQQLRVRVAREITKGVASQTSKTKAEAI